MKAIDALRLVGGGGGGVVFDIIVSGAGSTAVNGGYIEDGSQDGKLKYVRSPSPGTIKWDSSSGEWFVSLISAIYSSTDDVATPDLVTTWVQEAGDLPVPTVTAG